MEGWSEGRGCLGECDGVLWAKIPCLVIDTLGTIGTMRYDCVVVVWGGRGQLF